jgi:hypothetical protein
VKVEEKGASSLMMLILCYLLPLHFGNLEPIFSYSSGLIVFEMLGRAVFLCDSFLFFFKEIFFFPSGF